MTIRDRSDQRAATSDAMSKPSARGDDGSVESLLLRLAGLIPKSVLGRWLETPNDAFEGLKPLEVIERGETDRLWNMIDYLESGVAS